MPASKFWYVRMFIYGRGIVKKSTRCERLSDAREFAISWYEDRLLEKKQHKAIGSQSFAVFAARLQETQKRQISRGELVPEMAAYDKQRLDRDVLPRFGTTHIANVNGGAKLDHQGGVNLDHLGRCEARCFRGLICHRRTQARLFTGVRGFFYS
ncbi:MAG: hypothetical protein QF521_10305 [Alphaproteobacteria bacterium]|nr:hypothetical protein [Alphaproteobacteria bacterium]